MSNRGPAPQKTLADFETSHIVDALHEMFALIGSWPACDAKAIKIDVFAGKLQVNVEVNYDLLYAMAKQDRRFVRTIPIGNRDMFIYQPQNAPYRLVAYRTRHSMEISGQELPEPNFEGD